MNTKRRLIYAMKNLLEKHEIEQITIEMILKEPPEYIARLLKESIPSALKNFIL